MKIKTKCCINRKVWYRAKHMARHCRTRPMWLPVARQGRPKLTPENRHADHEAQALVEVVASTNGREQLAPCTGVLPNTSVDLSPLDLLATVASAATPLPTNDQSIVKMTPTSDPGVAPAPPSVPLSLQSDSLSPTMS